MKNVIRRAAQACTDTVMEIVDEVEVCAQNDVATALTLVTLNVDPESRLTRPLISKIHVAIRASAHEEEYGRLGRVLYMSRHRQAVKAVEEMLVEIEKNMIDGDFPPTVSDLLDIFPIEDDEPETVVDLTDPGSAQ
jgi:hypothetical protein